MDASKFGGKYFPPYIEAYAPAAGYQVDMARFGGKYFPPYIEAVCVGRVRVQQASVWGEIFPPLH